MKYKYLLRRLSFFALLFCAISNSFIASASSSESYVDLGLPSGTLWATCNVGARNPWDYGFYFQWGNIFQSENYDEEECVLYNKWENYINGDPNFDPATYNWGSFWCMPDLDQCSELRYCCKWKWTSMHGVNGVLGTGPNGNTIFFPAGGFKSNFNTIVETINIGTGGTYWSGTQDSATSAFAFDFDYDDPMDEDYLSLEVQPVYKTAGCPVRAVIKNW